MILQYQEIWGHYQVARACRRPHHPGSSWRGSFGRALHQASAEAYEAIFAPTVLSHRELPPHLFQGHALPRPWVIIVPPPGNSQHEEGDVLTLGLRLFGGIFEQHRRAIETALADVGRRLAQRPTRSGSGPKVSGPALTLLNIAGPYRGEVSVQSSNGTAQRVVIEFLTPTHLRLKGAADGHPDFVRLLELIEMRVARLSALYGDVTPAPPLSLERASNVRLSQTRLRNHTWHSSASGGRSKRKIQGYLGSLTYEGAVGPYVELLRAAEAVHLGSDSTYGLGRVRISLS